MTTLNFVVGGAASGKSAFAERWVRSFEKPKTYVATLDPFDDEMRAKVVQHQMDRGPDWDTIEAPLHVVDVLRETMADRVILLDCVTLWLTNLLLAERDIDAETSALVSALMAAPCDVVVVSNEVGMGIVPDNALSRTFRNAQGRLNQRLAAAADNAVTVVAGLPVVLKGTCPIAGRDA